MPLRLQHSPDGTACPSVYEGPLRCLLGLATKISQDVIWREQTFIACTSTRLAQSVQVITTLRFTEAKSNDNGIEKKKSVISDFVLRPIHEDLVSDVD